jgi:MoaA/NifB/PqqE/SkfB family radical SAM enzyme
MFLSRRMGLSLAPPDWLSLNLTLRCNLRCRMCTTCFDVVDELSTREVLDVVDQAALMGVRILNPLGGEPLMRPDLERILSHAASKDFYVTLTTNGTLLLPERARGLARIPPEKLHVTFSLDGPRPVHDAIRGEGAFDRALLGYEALRRADREAGNPHRKILVNTLVHAENLESLPEFLEDLARLGFDGVQLLSLFPHPQRAATDLFVRAEQLDALDALIERLIAHPPGPCSVLNRPAELRMIASQARGRLTPLEAPCWAGFKELYVNSDGRVLMCDGNLDFLAGSWGSTRASTLQELWASSGLRARRAEVRRCTRPCAQTCYLRPASDAALPLLREALGVVAERARPAIARPRGWIRRPIRQVEGGVLTLELSDVCDCEREDCAMPHERFAKLVAHVPEPMASCHREPDLWSRWRDRHFVDFGRGFMGFELVRALVASLDAARIGFPTLTLSWRGEPLLHPEILPIYDHVLGFTGEGRLFGRLDVETRGLLLTRDLARAAMDARHAPQTWRVDLDRLTDATPWEALRERLRSLAGGGVHVVLCRVASGDGGLARDLARARELLPELRVAAGLPRDDATFWLRLEPASNFLDARRARERLLAEAGEIGVVPALPAPNAPFRCLAAERFPVVSWDGRLLLCPLDTGMELRVGEVARGEFSRLWQSRDLATWRDEARRTGRPGLAPCRDCHWDLRFGNSRRRQEPPQGVLSQTSPRPSPSASSWLEAHDAPGASESSRSTTGAPPSRKRT